MAQRQANIDSDSRFHGGVPFRPECRARSHCLARGEFATAGRGTLVQARIRARRRIRTGPRRRARTRLRARTRTRTWARSRAWARRWGSGVIGAATRGGTRWRRRRLPARPGRGLEHFLGRGRRRGPPDPPIQQRDVGAPLDSLPLPHRHGQLACRQEEQQSLLLALVLALDLAFEPAPGFTRGLQLEAELPELRGLGGLLRIHQHLSDECHHPPVQHAQDRTHLLAPQRRRKAGRSP